MKSQRPLLAAVALLLLAACQTTPTELGQGLGAALSPEAPLVAERLTALRERADGLRSLRAAAHVALSSPAGSLSRPQRLVVEQPNRLRIEILALFDQVAAVLATDGETYSFVDLRTRSSESGPVDEGILWRTAGIDLAPRELVSLLLGSAPLGADEDIVAAQRFEDASLELELRGRGGISRLTISEDGVLRRFERRDPAGALLWTAFFDDIDAIDGVAFARKVSMTFERIEGGLEVDFHHVELNPELPEGVFVLHVPTGG